MRASNAARAEEETERAKRSANRAEQHQRQREFERRSQEHEKGTDDSAVPLGDANEMGDEDAATAPAALAPTRPARARAAGPAAEPSARRSTRSASNS